MKQFKQIRLHITRYICGNPLLVNSDYIGLVDGFPKRFLYLKSIIDSNRENPNVMRAIFTLVTFTRAVVPTAEEDKKILPDYSSISDRYSGRLYTIPT